MMVAEHITKSAAPESTPDGETTRRRPAPGDGVAVWPRSRTLTTWYGSLPPDCPRPLEERWRRRLDRQVEVELFFLLENDPALIPALVAGLHELAARFRLFDEATATRVDVALNEALSNGMHHGNLELDSGLREERETTYLRLGEGRRRLPPYRDRRLYVRARLSRTEAVYVIRDEGPGFDPAALPDPTDPAHLEKASGRGLLLIRAFMDEVRFNRAGNQITLVKRRTIAPIAGTGVALK